MDAHDQLDDYPARLEIDFPERVNKLTTFFRLFAVIPIFVVLAVLQGSFNASWIGDEGWRGTSVSSGGVLFLPTLLLLLFRQKYPRWWFDWNLNLTKFGYRVMAYFLLLRHEYPSTDEEQAVHLELRYPDAKSELNRWLPLVKWLLALPHYIVLVFLGLGAAVVTVIAWFAILFGGSYPASLFSYVVGVQRWSLRVHAYAFLLTTDKYPPFSLS